MVADRPLGIAIAGVAMLAFGLLFGHLIAGDSASRDFGGELSTLSSERPGHRVPSFPFGVGIPPLKVTASEKLPAVDIPEAEPVVETESAYVPEYEAPQPSESKGHYTPSPSPSAEVTVGKNE